MQKKGNGLSLTVYEYLKDMILNMKLVPGEKVPESKIAEHFGISRTPIREAMRRLENEGLIEIYPNRFAQIATFSTDYVQQLGIVRLELEKLAVQLAIFYGCNADFMKLRTVADRCYEAAQRKEL